VLYSQINLNFFFKRYFFLKFYNFFLISLFFFLIITFFSLDLFIFYISFELTFIPLFFMIGVTSYKRRRIHAMYLLLFFTVFSSFFLLTSIFCLFSFCNSLFIDVILNHYFSIPREIFLWFLMFISFSVKIPMYPFHSWLPEAHVEAPTEGSVLLAGALLKVGGFGFLRYLIPLFPFSCHYYSPYVICMASIGVFYASMLGLRQLDIKKVIAYSSIAHMNFCVISLFVFNPLSIVGSTSLMLAHGITSSGLFFFAGMLYSRFHTKNLLYYSGIVYGMPLFSAFFFVFCLMNMGFPCFGNFLGEIFIVLGVFKVQCYWGCFFLLYGILFTGIYMIWLYSRICFFLPEFRQKVLDLTFLEFFILTLLFFVSFWWGIYPNWIFLLLEQSMCLFFK